MSDRLSASAREPVLVAGRFRLVRPLGEGGMGRVVLAADTWRDGRTVALKLAPDDDAGARAALEHEFLLLASLRHPFIVAASELGTCPKTRQSWLAMEHADGLTLGEATRGASPERVAAMLGRLARALDFLHARGWVHGDVKCENAIVIGTGDAWTLRLVDFGLARRAGEPPAHRGFSGTLTHAAPEVLAGAPADPRSDLYALGVVAHELLAGSPPFAERDPLALAEAHRAREAPALASRAPSVPRPLATVVDELLAKEPSSRPRDGAAVAEAIDRAFPGAGVEPQEARLAWARAARLVAREPAEAATLALAARARDAADEGTRVLWLVGAEGQGKTRLLDAIGPRVQGARGIVLRGIAGAEPLSLLAGPLRDLLRLLGADSAIVASRASALAAALPELARADEEPLPADERLPALADATWELLRAVASRPVALLLDDLSAASEDDAKAVGLLARLVELDARRGRRAPFVMTGALPPELAASPAWRVALAAGLVERLSPLDAPAMKLLVEEMLPGLDSRSAASLAEAMSREGGGRARLAEDWIAELVRKGLLARRSRGFDLDASPAALQPPPGADARARRDVEALNDEARALLLATSVAPVALAPSLAARAAGLGGGDDASLDALEARGLVVVAATPAGRTLAPASELVRRAALAAAPDEARRLAGALFDEAASRALSAADRAAIAESAGRLEQATALLHEALRDAEARHDAARVAALAARLARLSRGRERRDALRRAAMALLDADRVAEAEGAAAAARAEGREDACEDAAQALVEGRAARRRGANDRAADLLRGGVEAASSAGLAPSFDLAAELGRTLLALQHPDAQGVIEALAAREDLTPRQRVAARVLQSARLLRSRDTERAAVVLEATRADARKLGLALTEASVENNLGIASLRARDLAGARRHFERAARLRRRAGMRGALAGTLSNLALVELERGRWREAARHARTAAEIHEDVGNRGGELLATLNAVAAAANAEDLAGLEAGLARCEALVGDGTDPVLVLACRTIAAEAAWQGGDAARAAARARETEALSRAAGDEARRWESRALQAVASSDLAASRALAAEIGEPPRRAALPPFHVLTGLAQRLAAAPRGWLVPWLGDVETDAEAATRLASAAVARCADDPGTAPGQAGLAAMALACSRRAAGAPAAEIARLVRKAAPLAEIAGIPSLHLQVHAARAWLAHEQGDAARAEHALEIAVRLLRRQAAALPPARRDAFLARPDRVAFRDALLRLRSGRLDAARDAGWSAMPAAVSVVRRARPKESEASRREVARSRRRAERLAEILEIARGISALLPVDELLSRALDSAMRFMNADRGFIVLGGAGEPLRFAVSRDREGREVPRAGFAVSHSVLQEVIRTRQSVLSSDARADERFTSKASVLALDLRSVLVAPLVASSEVVGAIYLDNLQASGVFGEDDRELLGLLAAQAAVAVENARLHASRIEKERIEQELSVARGIQQSLLPRRLPEDGAFRLAAVMHPARELGGDWYDLVAGEAGEFTLTVGDVSGKGVGAALFMVMARTILRAELRAGEPLDRWLVRANAEIEAQVADDQFLTLAAVRAGGGAERTLRYALAGHEPPIVFRAAEGVAEAVPEGGLALGMLPSLEGRVEERELRLRPGDVVTLVSDGVTECRSPSGELWGRERLRQAIARHGRAGADGLLAALLLELDSWRGTTERSDDLTIVVLEARGSEA